MLDLVPTPTPLAHPYASLMEPHWPAATLVPTQPFVRECVNMGNRGEAAKYISRLPAERRVPMYIKIGYVSHVALHPTFHLPAPACYALLRLAPSAQPPCSPLLCGCAATLSRPLQPPPPTRAKTSLP